MKCPKCDCEMTMMNADVDLVVSPAMNTAPGQITPPVHRHIQRAFYACPRCVFTEIQTREVLPCQPSR
jgi:hypothetical protein